MARILFVEDDAGLARGLRYNLEAEGYEVVHTADGELGLREALDGDFDLILLDIMLPGRSGFEILEKIRRKRDLTPVILLSARGAPEERVKGLRLGADDYMTKPFSLKELLARIELRSRGARGRREAAHVQRAMEPHRAVHGPAIEIAGISRPLEETGGDYFDYITLDSGRLALAMGDAAGHGIAAALGMSAARSLLRAFLPGATDPGAALAAVNRQLMRDLPAGAFMSLFVAEIDTVTGAIRYASAGHSGLVRRDGEFDELASTGPALGLVADASYETRVLEPLAPDDLLFLSTDGVEEAQREGELFGDRRLRRVLWQVHDRTPTEIADCVVGAVTDFAGGALSDDLALAVVKGAEKVTARRTA